MTGRHSEDEKIIASVLTIRMAVDGLTRLHLKSETLSRCLDILISRIYSDPPETYTELARRHNISRERVRQINKLICARLIRYYHVIIKYKKPAGFKPNLLAEYFETPGAPAWKFYFATWFTMFEEPHL